jgi:hypothetical protein
MSGVHLFAPHATLTNLPVESAICLQSVVPTKLRPGQCTLSSLGKCPSVRDQAAHFPARSS